MAASLSFNPTRIQTQTVKSHKPISSFTSFTKPIQYSLKFAQVTSKSSKNQSRSRHFQPKSVSESSVSALSPEVGIDEENDDPTVELSYLDPDTDPESIAEWELDFCSRPILDIRGKKVWELVGCDSSLSLQHTKYFPNNVINSITQKDAIVSISEDLGVPLPEKIRFFRPQMQTIITKACKELGIKPILSKREEISSLDTRFVFGAGLDLDLLGIEIDDNTLIPGLSVASSRAQPLAAWMNGLEVYSIEADTSRASLILSVGISTRYVFATYKKTPVTTSEAEAWEAAKKACGGLHFLAIQEDLDSEDCVGFWLLLDLPPPPVYVL